MPLTEHEKVRIRHHTGHLNVAVSATFVLGTPAGVETQHIIEGAMNRVLESALPTLRDHINILDSIEAQMVDDHELLAVKKLGEIEIADKEQDNLDKRYDRWVNSLCNILGVVRNPFDKRASGGVNVPVVNG